MWWTSALVTTPSPQARPSRIHPRLTVARASAAQRTRLVEALALPAVGPADLAEAAVAVATERSAARIAARARLDAVAARLAHDAGTARSQLEHLTARQRALLEGADWTVEAEADLPALHETVEAARASLEACQLEQRTARSGLDKVLEQRTAAGVTMEEADRELSELVGVGMDETALRRELEAAGHAVRTAQDAHAASVVRLRELDHERASCLDRANVLRQHLGGAPTSDQCTDAEVDRVLEALTCFADASQFGELDPDAVALADAFRDLNADLAEVHANAGPRPDASALAGAEAEVARAAEALERLQGDAAATVLTPEHRAEVDAAHAAVVRAEERIDRRIGAAGARRRLDEARSAERALLDRHGFATYIDVVLSGGRAASADPRRLVAERSLLAATAALDGLRRAMEGSPEERYLASEQARLLAHAVDTLGVDPGDDPVELLRAHPAVPRGVLVELRDALAAVGVHPVAVSLADAAEAWLEHQAALIEAQRNAIDAAAATRDEIDALVQRASAIEHELAAAREQEAHAAEQLDLSSRSVGAFEAELSVRVGEDAQRLQRFAAAEQLRSQIAALAATLARAEEEAIAALDGATERTTAAELVVDRAQGSVAQVATRARGLAGELPIDLRPEGDVLRSLAVLGERLRDHARVLQPEIDAADLAVTRATARVDEAVAAAEAAGTGLEPPRPEDVEDGLRALLASSSAGAVLLDDPLNDQATQLRSRLLDVVVEASSVCAVVFLTDDPDVLGWAIELPADRGSVVPADALFDLSSSAADGHASPLAVLELSASTPTDHDHTARDPETDAPSAVAPRWAGRR